MSRDVAPHNAGRLVGDEEAAGSNSLIPTLPTYGGL
jgi:hypothetical protein